MLETPKGKQTQTVAGNGKLSGNRKIEKIVYMSHGENPK